jgi:hypothetical protein
VKYIFAIVYTRGQQTTARNFILSGPPTAYQPFESIVNFLQPHSKLFNTVKLMFFLTFFNSVGSCKNYEVFPLTASDSRTELQLWQLSF